MFRARDPQRSLFSARNQYRDALNNDSFYALLADHAEELFDDYQFEYLYFEDNGRPCIPPGQMFTLLLLQMHAGCSDKEAVERARFDIRWLAALDMEPTAKLCGRSTLQEFRARVLLSNTAEKQFKSILGLARKLGIIKGPLQIAMDTTPILGRGAVKDTYNLIGDGIRKVGQLLARLQGESPEQWASQHDFSKYWEVSSLKGEAGIDWSDETQRRVFLNSLVADAERILLLADTLAKKAVEYAPKVLEVSALLRRLIIQDTEPDPDSPTRTNEKEELPAERSDESDPTETLDSGSPEVAPTEEPSPGSAEASANSHLVEEMIKIRKGTATDRVVSAHDPDMRHGRKSSSKLFNGYKLSLTNDTSSGLILSLDILSGGAGDSEGAYELVVQAQENTGLNVEKGIADCAYGDGATRQKFQDAGIDLSAKVPASPKGVLFPKSRFILDLTGRIATATCPAGKISSAMDYRTRKEHKDPVRRVRFSKADCTGCVHHDDCLRKVDKKSRWGRSLELHPQEKLLQEARQRQASPVFRKDIKLRQTAEHTIARVIQLGARQARYFGKRKTKYQMTMIALVANLGIIQRATSGLIQPPVIALVALGALGLIESNTRSHCKGDKQTVSILQPQMGPLGEAA
jgi:IS5 family transposase